LGSKAVIPSTGVDVGNHGMVTDVSAALADL